MEEHVNPGAAVHLKSGGDPETIYVKRINRYLT